MIPIVTRGGRVVIVPITQSSAVTTAQAALARVKS